MYDRLKGLHQVMTKGDLKTSAEFLVTHFGVNSRESVSRTLPQPQDKHSGGVGQPSRSRPAQLDQYDHQAGAGNTQLNVNFNHKASTAYPSEASRSVETIYKNAVMKRVSSSSEEDNFELNNNPLEILSDPDFQPDYDDEPMEQEESQQECEDPPGSPVHNPRKGQQHRSEEVLMDEDIHRTYDPDEMAQRVVLEAAKSKIGLSAKNRYVHAF